MGLIDGALRELRASWFPHGTYNGTLPPIPRNSQLGYANKSGQRVDADSALRHSAVWACVYLIADLISTLPLHTYRQIDGISSQVNDPQLVKQADPNYDQVDWVAMILQSALLRGNAYGYVAQTDSLARPTLIQVLNPDMVTPLIGTGNLIEGYRMSGGDVLPPERVKHFRAHVSPGNPVGLSPIAYAAQTIGLGLAAEAFGASFFGESGHPTGVLQGSEKIDAEEARAIKTSWVNATRNSREPAVIGQGLIWQPIQIAPEESQFLETIKANDNSIARFFRVESELINAETGSRSMTYANIEHRMIKFLTTCANPWIVKLERWISEMLPQPQFVKFNADALLRVDLKTRYEAHDTALRGGWRSANEIRAVEDLAPIEGGDQYLWPPYAVTTEPAGVTSSGTDSNASPTGN